jgi:hypothetical protein
VTPSQTAEITNEMSPRCSSNQTSPRHLSSGGTGVEPGRQYNNGHIHSLMLYK